MNISRLLSSCADPPSPSTPHELTVSADLIGASYCAFQSTTHNKNLTEATFLNLAKPRTKAKAKAKAARQRNAPTSRLTVGNDKPLVERKRKRRYSAKQLQAMHENQHDESQLYNLTLDINGLKQEVQDYLVHKSIHATRALVNRQNFNAGVLGTTHHFFQVLRSGFRAWETQEAAFLDVTLDQDVAVGTVADGSAVTGSNQFFKQWRRYSKLLQTRSVTHSSITILVSDSESCVVECKGEFEGRLTLAAIEAVFPHILQDAELLGKVVNRKFVCPRKTLVYFDASGRIVQYEANVDFFAGLNRILASNPVDLITLMSNARISCEGSLIPDVYDDDYRRAEMDGEDREEIHTERYECDGFVPASLVVSTTSSSFASISPFNSSCSSRSSVAYILS